MPSDYYGVYATKFGVDSSSRFPFRVRTNRQTDVTEFPTLAGGYTGGVVIILPMMCYIYMHWQSHYINGQLNYINKT